MSPEYTPQIGDELIQYIRNYQGVVACGRFNNNKMILNGELVKTLVIEKDIANMGNLLLDNDNLKSKKNGSENMAYVGYSYRNEYKTGIQFNYYEENEKSSCEIAGYLKKGASWPLKGKLFGGVSDIDSYNLDNTIVVITPNYEYFDNYNIKEQVFINKKFELIYNQKKVDLETLIKNLIKLENTPYYDYSISMLRLNIDKKLPIDSLYKLNSKIYFNTGFDFFYATYSKSTKYDEHYFQDNHIGIKDSLILNLQEIVSNDLFISKFSNIISLKQNNKNQIAFNSIILNYDEIVEKIKTSILLDNNYIIKIELKENATFSDYISILSLAKKGFSKANMQILKESKNDDEYYNFHKRNLDFMLLDINQPHPTKELFKLTEIPKKTNDN